MARGQSFKKMKSGFRNLGSSPWVEANANEQIDIVRRAREWSATHPVGKRMNYKGQSAVIAGKAMPQGYAPRSWMAVAAFVGGEWMLIDTSELTD